MACQLVVLFHTHWLNVEDFNGADCLLHVIGLMTIPDIRSLYLSEHLDSKQVGAAIINSYRQTSSHAIGVCVFSRF